MQRQGLDDAELLQTLDGMLTEQKSLLNVDQLFKDLANSGEYEQMMKVNYAGAGHEHGYQLFGMGGGNVNLLGGILSFVLFSIGGTKYSW